jgi:hypothetical protein
MLVVIGIDCIGSYTSKFHTIMTTMAPRTEEDRIYNIYLYTVIHMFCKHRNSYLGFVEDLSVPASKHAYSICPVKYKYQLITCFVEIILLVQASRLSYIFFFFWLIDWCFTPTLAVLGVKHQSINQSIKKMIMKTLKLGPIINNMLVFLT